jgi:hypothetical protein
MVQYPKDFSLGSIDEWAVDSSLIQFASHQGIVSEEATLPPALAGSSRIASDGWSLEKHENGVPSVHLSVKIKCPFEKLFSDAV